MKFLTDKQKHYIGSLLANAMNNPRQETYDETISEIFDYVEEICSKTYRRGCLDFKKVIAEELELDPRDLTYIFDTHMFG